MIKCLIFNRPTFDQSLKNIESILVGDPRVASGPLKEEKIDLRDKKEKDYATESFSIDDPMLLDSTTDQTTDPMMTSTSEFICLSPSSPPTYPLSPSEQKRKFQEDLLNHANSDKMLRQSSSLIIEHVQLDTSTQCTEQNLMEKCKLKQIPARKLAIWIQQWIHRNQRS